jgi:leucyl aminopeptidase
MINVSVVTSSPTTAHQLAIPLGETGLLASEAVLTQQVLDLHKADKKPGTVARVMLGQNVALVVGVGADYQPKDFAAAAVRAASDKAVLVLNAKDAAEAKAFAEGVVLGQKTPTRFKKDSSSSLEVQIVCQESADISLELKVANTIVAIRELINLPANELWPDKLAQEAKAMAKGLPIDVEIWDEKKLEKERCGGILGVGMGSVRPPRLVKLTYKGGGKHFALVGKGITFDTGGLSLKPAESMVGMKYDMAGAASVLGAVIGAAQLGVKADITGFMCLAENMPSGEATRPGDVLTLRNGKTVEVLNTDAEGRLVLGDGLSLASEMNPDHIIDIATLTGAATIALGHRYAGLMGHGPALELAQKAAAKTGELLWHMPLPSELREMLNSELADITNVKIGNRAGGMLIGGIFLSEFVSKDASWAHLDIASSGNNDLAPYSVYPGGATGVMIRTMIEMTKHA